MIKKLLTLCFILIGTISLNAQTISGTVTDINGGAAISNQVVYIYSLDSTSTYSTSATTNASGMYSFSSVPTSTNGFSVYTNDCQQQPHYQTVQSNSGTANFSICTGGNPVGCNAYFSSFADSSNANLIYFTDQSAGNPTSWSWSFGDGTSSNTQNPNHIYTTNGTYTVTLSISSSTCTDTITQNIVVGNTSSPCNAAFYTIPDSSNANLINFFDQSTGNPTSWNWSFGDGTSSNTQNPNHTYATNGTYVVTLSISSPNCTNTISQYIMVGNTSSPCTAAFYTITDSSNANLIYFIDQSTPTPFSWYWDFGDGSNSSSQTPSHQYASSGTYTASLLITSANCFDTVFHTVVVGTNPQTNYITGYVYANSGMVNSGTVSLFDTITNQYVATTTIDSSTYLFTNIPNGSYKILATPGTNTVVGQNFAPTYYGDVVFWAAATTISIPAAVPAPYTINLTTIPTVPGGNGSISGNVGTGSKSGVSNSIVNLLDNNMALIASTKTKTNGDYNFSNLAMGTYTIWVEIAGKTTTPITVTLTTVDNSVNGNDFVVDNNEVVPKSTSINSNSFNGELNLYPNPVVDIMNIELNTTDFGNFNFNIYSITGQLMSTIQVNISSANNVIRINTSELSQGTYILRIQNTNTSSIQKLFIK